MTNDLTAADVLFAQRIMRDLQRAQMAEQQQKTSNKSSMKPRLGKTKRDRERGVLQQNESNKAIRREWERSRSSNKHAVPFPYHTCNGKKNRFFDNKGKARA